MDSSFSASDGVGAAAGWWTIATPSRPPRVPGVRFAGFSSRTGDLVDLAVVPHPAVTLFIDVGDGELADGTGQVRHGQSFAMGLAATGVRGRGRNIDCLQVRLSPLCARALLTASPASLEGAVVSLEDVWGAAAGRTQEQLYEARSWDERFAIVGAELERRYEDAPVIDDEVASAWALLVASHGCLRVEQLAARTGWSRRRLWSRFRDQIGVTPKRAAQLIRFDVAAHRLASGGRGGRVAAELGYADQSHLHRDVRALAGVTPAALATSPWLAVDDAAWPGERRR